MKKKKQTDWWGMMMGVSILLLAVTIMLLGQKVQKHINTPEPEKDVEPTLEQLLKKVDKQLVCAEYEQIEKLGYNLTCENRTYISCGINRFCVDENLTETYTVLTEDKDACRHTPRDIKPAFVMVNGKCLSWKIVPVVRLVLIRAFGPQ